MDGRAREMTLKDYCFDGKKELKLKETPTDAGEYRTMKDVLTAKTGENMARAAELQEKLYAEHRKELEAKLNLTGSQFIWPARIYMKKPWEI